ncbi:nucleoside recognition domain-containing protein [Gottschalkiaceae bacterium SANA]|nr:nucleoside recognition domain-containing protein [Gottschalkiaceae bacterium SANA]
MNIVGFLRETFLGVGFSILKLSSIIIPLMIVMQVLKDYQWLDRLTRVLQPLGNKIGIRKDGLFPLLVGILFGISYGSGVIIQSVESGEMNEKDRLLVAVFLVLCHAVIEDTLLFAAVGANGYILLLTRVLVAFLATAVFSRQYVKKRGEYDENRSV